jgi:hypothetical protein
MNIAKRILIGAGETQKISFRLSFAAERLAIWVRPGDVIGTSMSYIARVIYSGEEQQRWERSTARIDVFKDDLVPGGSEFTLDVEVEIQNTDTKAHIFEVAFVTKSLAGEM